eukprot:CAMPEP_0203662570 /NCGR_PEP_ID=MMETSP0090-20130426/491_1 /ASSEMBLY_ACC=CAM_ASM_001088 /TAXON_ID=426623 /ORGANISM="Chaetoceros affinis, Strain CCMP159" /LENGTH=427 /DNA_ID=CAMNT_0050525379 /DNA_START=78 /DNA_END=1361 /DNA_ORIENTATION=+
MANYLTLCFSGPPKIKKSGEKVCADWFEQTFGFNEKRLRYEGVRKQFSLEENDTVLVSLANGRKFQIGRFETPSLEALNQRLEELSSYSSDFDFGVDYDDDDDDGDDDVTLFSGLEFEHLSGDVKALLLDPENSGAVFQVASRFNCLENTDSSVTPDAGISKYVEDDTQGPTCATACSAGTIYRNYFVNGHGQGGKKGKQIDCLADIGKILGNEESKFWRMQNGYALPSKQGSMKDLTRHFINKGFLPNRVMETLKVGVQYDTEVVTTENDRTPHCVTQVYSSALPISYTTSNKDDFELFARIILCAAYQATFVVAAIKALETKKRVNLYLTKIGGGLFANRSKWIADAIRSCLRKFEDFPLNVYLVHYGSLEQAYIQGLRGKKQNDQDSIITDYFASNIDVAKLSPSTSSGNTNDSGSSFSPEPEN